MEPDSEPLKLKTFSEIQALLGDYEDELKDDSDEEIYEAEEEMDEEIQQEKHKEAVASYADLKAVVEGFVVEADNNRNNYDIVINNVMKTIDQINGARIEEQKTLLKALNRVSETLEAHSAQKASMQKITDTHTTTSGNITNLTKLLRNAKLPKIITQLNAFQTLLNTLTSLITATENTQITMHADISSMKVMVTKMFHAFKEFSSSTPSEHKVADTEKELVQELQDTQPILNTIVRLTTKPTLELKLIESSSRPQPTNPIIDITPPEQSILEEQPKISHTTPKPVRGKALSKPELIKVVTKVAIEAGVDPKLFRAPKVGMSSSSNKMLKKVLNREHMAKLMRLKVIPGEHEMNSTLPAPEQVPSLSPRRKRKALDMEPEVHITGLECNKSLCEGIPYVKNRVIKTPKHRIFFIDAFEKHAFQRVSDIYKVEVKTLMGYLVMAININTPENQRLCLLLRSMIDNHLDKERLKLKKVKLEAMDTLLIKYFCNFCFMFYNILVGLCNS
nr:protein kinase superfamily protein [Tanacetum cinerariifolium]